MRWEVPSPPDRQADSMGLASHFHAAEILPRVPLSSPCQARKVLGSGLSPGIACVDDTESRRCEAQPSGKSLVGRQETRTPASYSDIWPQGRGRP